MEPVAATLRHQLVAGYDAFVRSRLEERGWPDAPEAIAEGKAWLESALDELLAQPFARQQRGPLEVFQEALLPVTRALESAGVEPIERDPVTENALPGDVFGLAPASSSELGDDVWEAHVAWGVAKAAAHRPSVLVATSNLLDLDRIESSIRGTGFRAERYREGQPTEAVVAFADLEMPGSDDAIRALSAAGIEVTAYGPHVDDRALVRARSLGAANAVARSRFFKEPASFLPTYA